METDPRGNFEARLSELEQLVAHLRNPGHLSTAEAVSLKEHFETRLAAIEQTTDRATNAMEKRLDGLQAGKFVTRDEVNLQLAPMKEQMATLQTFKDKLEGKASMSAVAISYILGFAGLALGVISLLKG